MTHPPPNLHGPSGQSSTISHVVPPSANTVVSQGYVPPYVLVGYVPPYVPPYGSGNQPAYQSYNYGFVAPQSQGIPNYNIPMHPFMGQTGGGYYPISQGHGVYNNHTYMNQPY